MRSRAVARGWVGSWSIPISSAGATRVDQRWWADVAWGSDWDTEALAMLDTFETRFCVCATDPRKEAAATETAEVRPIPKEEDSGIADLIGSCNSRNVAGLRTPPMSARNVDCSIVSKRRAPLRVSDGGRVCSKCPIWHTPKQLRSKWKATWQSSRRSTASRRGVRVWTWETKADSQKVWEPIGVRRTDVPSE